MDLLASAEAWLAGQRREKLSGEATISRGIVTTASVLAMQGSTLAESNSVDGMQLTVKIVDWVIAKADYQFASVVSDPRPGDRITDASSRVFEVCELGGEPCFRWHDRAGDHYRIHTNEIS